MPPSSIANLANVARVVKTGSRVKSGALGSEHVYDIGDPNKYGSSYSGLVEANPYANMSYSQSPWQKFLASLGFRTNYDAYRESLALQAKEYDASIAAKAYNENYDSAASQADRLREAGVNPDLNGVDAGSSSALSDDGNPAIAPEGNDFEMVTNVAGAMVSTLETLFGFAQSGFNILGQFQDLRSKKLANDKSFMENSLMAFLNASLPDEYNSDNRSDGFTFWRFGYDKSSRLGRLLGSRSKKYASAVNLFRESLVGQEEEAAHRANRAANRSRFSSIRGSAYYSEFNDVLDAFEGALTDLAKDVSTTNMQKDTAQNVYDAKRLEALNPAEMAGYEASTAASNALTAGSNAKRASAEASLAEARDKAKNSIDDLIGSLEAFGDKGNWLAQIGAILMSLVKVRVFQL